MKFLTSSKFLLGVLLLLLLGLLMQDRAPRNVASEEPASGDRDAEASQ